AGNPGGAVVARTITVNRRQMAVYDDVVASLFQSTGLGAIKLSSPDDFIATQRIYAQSADGTLGQFVLGQDASAAKAKGAIIQMKANGLVRGTFRTNIGFVNPNNAVANVTLRLYDKSNTGITRSQPLVLQPNAVLTPSNVVGYFDNPTNDLADAWVSYESDQPIFAYGSVVDNGTTDPTFIPAQEDSGVDNTPPGPTVKTFNVTASQWQFSINPDGVIEAKVGERIVLQLTASDVSHGFAIGPPYNISRTMSPGTTTEVEFDATTAGTFEFFCTVTSCGDGHDGMTGTMIINP
ncbi:MAG TPA: hypothetical protein VIL97_06915, partial [Thermoanaerobaculia bacterium]